MTQRTLVSSTCGEQKAKRWRKKSSETLWKLLILLKNSAKGCHPRCVKLRHAFTKIPIIHPVFFYKFINMCKQECQHYLSYSTCLSCFSVWAQYSYRFLNHQSYPTLRWVMMTASQPKLLSLPKKSHRFGAPRLGIGAAAMSCCGECLSGGKAQWRMEKTSENDEEKR